MNSIKSWWYWNVSSKYDAMDLFVFTYFPALVILIICMAISEGRERKEFTAQCSVKDGVVIKDNRKLYCIDAKVIK